MWRDALEHNVAGERNGAVVADVLSVSVVGTVATARPAPSRSSRSASRAKPTKRPAGKSRARASSTTSLTTAAKGAASFVARQPEDLWGWLGVAVGLFLFLGLDCAILGVVGHGLHVGLGEVLGVDAYLLGPSLLVAGITLVAGRAYRGLLGLTVTLAVFSLCCAALGDLASGSPSIHASGAALRQAGGFLGALVGRPLGAGIGGLGASVLLGLLAAISSVLLCGSRPKKLLPVARFALRQLDGLGRALARPRPPRLGLLTGAGEERATAGEAARQFYDFANDTLSTAPMRVIEQDETDEAPQQFFDGALEAGDLFSSSRPAPAPAPAPATEDRAPEPVAAGIAEQLGLGVVAKPAQWRLPPLKTLVKSQPQGTDKRAVEERGKALERSLQAHGVGTHLVGYTVGPTVTRFELELGEGVKVARVTSLAKDIAYAMASPDVRILAPIPGRSAIGVEVPNVERQLVTLGDVLSSEEARRASHPLEVAVGRDIAGRAVMVNLAEMPHLLIAGATGAGKSSSINTMISSILMRSTPDEVRLILVDPKRVELGQYNGLPHLLTPVVVNPKKAANALAWAVAEMEKRYDLLAEAGMRDITGYNAAFDRGEFAPSPIEAPLRPRAAIHAEEAALEDDPELAEESAPLDAPPSRFTRLPYILVVVDELNDLMMVAARDVEDSICRIAQMARAVGIHLVIATQRPSVDVITGVIKANIPSRLALSVSSLADSRVILDQPGAERLIGRGDMLLLGASSSVPRRIQAPWISEDEIHAVVGFWRRQSAPDYLEGVVGEDNGAQGTAGGPADDDDELLAQAMELVVRSQLGSTSMLQRKLRVGFSRAGRLMDLLERRGVVGPSEGSKARAVLMTPDELDSL